jgi:hypothetical protein
MGFATVSQPEAAATMKLGAFRSCETASTVLTGTAIAATQTKTADQQDSAVYCSGNDERGKIVSL